MPYSTVKQFPNFIKELHAMGYKKISLYDLTTQVMRFFGVSSEKTASIQVRALERLGHIKRFGTGDLFELIDIELENRLKQIASDEEPNKDPEEEANDFLEKITD
jgi:hypothetical protein